MPVRRGEQTEERRWLSWATPEFQIQQHRHSTLPFVKVKKFNKSTRNDLASPAILPSLCFIPPTIQLASRKRAAEAICCFQTPPVMLPPHLPPDSPYTHCYCEENIYLLAQKFISDSGVNGDWNVYIVFISNDSKTVVLRNQKNAPHEDLPVCWDYHVVLLLRNVSIYPPSDTENCNWVYDFDTRLPVPVPLAEYLRQTFSDQLPENFQSLFRLVPGEVYLEYFASDRSHMVHGDGSLLSPPPLYPPIYGSKILGRGIRSNLMENFVCMTPSDDKFGNVYSLHNFERWARERHH